MYTSTYVRTYCLRTRTSISSPKKPNNCVCRVSAVVIVTIFVISVFTRNKTIFLFSVFFYFIVVYKTIKRAMELEFKLSNCVCGLLTNFYFVRHYFRNKDMNFVKKKFYLKTNRNCRKQLFS